MPQAEAATKSKLQTTMRGYNAVTLTLMSLFVSPRSTLSFVGRNRLLAGASHSSRLFSSIGTSSKKKRLFPEEVNIIYDSKCNVCKLEIDFLRRRDEKLALKRGDQTRLKFTDLESGTYSSTDPANGGVTYEVGMASMHAVRANGQVLKGVPVFRLAYEQVNLGWLFAVTEISFVKRIADVLYNIFAKYRTVLTRGQSVESLVEVYREKKALEQQQQAEDCQVCQEKETR